MIRAVTFDAADAREIAKILNGLVGGMARQDEFHDENFTVEHIIQFQVFPHNPSTTGKSWDVLVLVEAKPLVK